MKTQKKNAQRLYLKKRNNRWKWMAGATAATAAGVTASQANAITINLVGNFIGQSGLGGGENNLNADLTGDGHPDLTIANAPSYVYPFEAGATLNGVRASFQFQDLDGFSARMRLGSRTAFYRYIRTGSSGGRSNTYGTPSLTGSIPLFFKDLHINGGAPTKGFLTVTVFTTRVDLDSFSYNTPLQGASLATIPDQGSSLALLAMGAGGILALRRWRATQGRSKESAH